MWYPTSAVFCYRAEKEFPLIAFFRYLDSVGGTPKPFFLLETEPLLTTIPTSETHLLFYTDFTQRSGALAG